MLRANITFAKVFRKSRFVFQYTPVLAILNGRLGGNADPTSDLSLGTVFTLSPRLTLTLKDDLGWHRTRQLFPDDLLLIDKQTGGLVQSYLLEPNGTLLTNSLSAAVDYKLSPRLLLSAVSTYVYSDIENAKNLFILHDSFNTVTLTYALSQRSNIGFVESVEFLHPVIPVSTNGLFQTSGLFYSEQFSPSLRISGQLGVQSAKAPGFGGAAWGVAGSLNLLKTCHADQLHRQPPGRAFRHFLWISNLTPISLDQRHWVFPNNRTRAARRWQVWPFDDDISASHGFFPLRLI